MDLETLRQKRINLNTKTDKTLNNLEKIVDESFRVANVAHNATQIISDLEKDFEKATKLNGKDITFLFFATALQVARQYLLTNFKTRVSDKEAAKAVKGKTKEHSNRSSEQYRLSVEEILSNPVPYDAIFGSKNLGLNIGGGFNHRARTLGHDPILGWIFGTMNIMTSTVTTSDFISYHVTTGFTANNRSRDKITSLAETSKVFYYAANRPLEGTEGILALSTSLIKQYIHIKSDIGSIAGLPLPGVSCYSPKLAKQLANYGLDSTNLLTVTKQASYSILINLIISFVHRLFYNEEKDISLDFYKVRTRKILLYSNLMATSSNVIQVGVRTYLGDNSALKQLDIGGVLVTIYRLISDTTFINTVKKEFIINSFNKKIRGDEFNFEEDF